MKIDLLLTRRLGLTGKMEEIYKDKKGGKSFFKDTTETEKELLLKS